MENNEIRAGDPNFTATVIPSGMTARCTKCGTSWPITELQRSGKQPTKHQIVCPKCSSNQYYCTR